MCKQKKLFTTKVPGFSLIELSFVMIIVGIIMAGVFKGQDLLDTARLQSCVSDFNRYRLAIMAYYDQFGQLPGNDANATRRFGSTTTNGDGKGFITKAEQPLVWQHLYLANLIDSEQTPTARIGGTISAITNPTAQLRGNFLILSKTPGTLAPLLTPHQAMILKSRAGETKPAAGTLQVLEGDGVSVGACVSSGEYNLSNKNPACVIAVAF
ncbi:type II secretion system protein [Candidatus Paracaedibacter symbiosus]|uniref:type II secretion system protein n=1 Tax=Candidatus Paracaedibacter symbiosus TaxID=244582 RepID=UPI0018DD2997|nr:prepilin-type N-terminal cleavage/methylation domain-containing protein [Candidatus Paracaedibacter symbiosus]